MEHIQVCFQSRFRICVGKGGNRGRDGIWVNSYASTIITRSYHTRVAESRIFCCLGGGLHCNRRTRQKGFPNILRSDVIVSASVYCYCLRAEQSDHPQEESYRRSSALLSTAADCSKNRQILPCLSQTSPGLLS